MKVDKQNNIYKLYINESYIIYNSDSKVTKMGCINKNSNDRRELIKLYYRLKTITESELENLLSSSVGIEKFDL